MTVRLLYVSNCRQTHLFWPRRGRRRLTRQPRLLSHEAGGVCSAAAPPPTGPAPYWLSLGARMEVNDSTFDFMKCFEWRFLDKKYKENKKIKKIIYIYIYIYFFFNIFKYITATYMLWIYYVSDSPVGHESSQVKSILIQVHHVSLGTNSSSEASQSRPMRQENLTRHISIACMLFYSNRI